MQLVAPTSTDERIALAAERTDGWLYLVTVAGTTGARAELSPALAPLVERTRALTQVPLYAGSASRRRSRRPLRASSPTASSSARRALLAAEDGHRRRSSASSLSCGPRSPERSASRARHATRRSGRRCARSARHARGRRARTGRRHPRRGRCVAGRDAHGDRVVAVAVEYELRDAERKTLARRRENVALVVGRRVSEQRPRRRGRRREACCESEIEHAGLRDRCADDDPRVDARRLRRQSRVEMPPRTRGGLRPNGRRRRYARDRAALRAGRGGRLPRRRRGRSSASRRLPTQRAGTRDSTPRARARRGRRTDRS